MNPVERNSLLWYPCSIAFTTAAGAVVYGNTGILFLLAMLAISAAWSAVNSLLWMAVFWKMVLLRLVVITLPYSLFLYLFQREKFHSRRASVESAMDRMEDRVMASASWPLLAAPLGLLVAVLTLWVLRYSGFTLVMWSASFVLTGIAGYALARRKKIMPLPFEPGGDASSSV